MKKNISLLLVVVLSSILAWCSSATPTKDSDKAIVDITTTSNTIDANTTYETIQVEFNGTSLVPEITNLTAGKNYKFIVTPTSDGIWAMTTMTIPGIDEKVYNIKKGVPITITINNAKAGNYDSVCEKYRMYQWKIFIQ